jgi:hypothetical protein
MACSSNAGPATTAGAMTSVAGAGAAAGGGGGDAAAVGGAAGAAGGAASGKLSFANDIYPKVIRSKCGACHNDAPSFGGLAFFPGGPETAYANLVGVRSGDMPNYLCSSSPLKRVEPGDPENSLMYRKITNPSCGGKMPPPAFGTTTPEQQELVRQWIADGALP